MQSAVSRSNSVVSFHDSTGMSFDGDDAVDGHEFFPVTGRADFGGEAVPVAEEKLPLDVDGTYTSCGNERKL